MDTILSQMIGKPTLKEAKIFTIVAENFPLVLDFKFYKTILSIPIVRKLPLGAKYVVKIGRIPTIIENHIDYSGWKLYKYQETEEGLSERISNDLQQISGRSMIIFDNAALVEMLGGDEYEEFLEMVALLKREGHFPVILYQSYRNFCDSNPQFKKLDYISDALFKVHTCRAGYFTAARHESIPTKNTFMPLKTETNYWVCNIADCFWSTDHLCFHDRRTVAKDYDLETEQESSQSEQPDQLSSVAAGMDQSAADSEQVMNDGSTLPYTQAQAPDKGRIFYYPDDDDSYDDEDPDDDLLELN